MVTWVADLSNYQRGINVAQVVREGFSAVICKATEGVTYRDAQFAGFTNAARDNGAIPGAYHYLRGGSAASQARVFYDAVAHQGGPTGWLIALDNEKDASWVDTQAWVAEWNRLTDGHPLLMYTGEWWWGPRGWPGASLTPHLWASHYVAGSGYASSLYGAVPTSWWSPGFGGWGEAILLQFTSQALVAGMRIDASAFRGTVAELKKLTRIGGNEVDLNDHVPGTGSVDRAGDRSVAEVLADLWQATLHGHTMGGDVLGTGAYVDSPLARPVTELTDAQVSVLADRISGVLVARSDNSLDAADEPAIIAAVKQALREGTDG